MVFRNPQMLTLLLFVPALLLVWWWRRKRLFSAVLLLRLLVLGLLVVALANPTVGRESSHDGPLVLLVDQSDSLTPQGQATLRSAAASLAAMTEQTGGERPQQVVTFWFGENTVAVGEAGAQAPEAPEASEAMMRVLDPSASDLAQALRTAREMLAPTGGRAVLLSDGRQNTGDVLSVAQTVADAGITVDVLPIEPLLLPEVRVAGVHVDPSLRMGESYQVQIDVERQIEGQGSEAAGVAVPATLQLWVRTVGEDGPERLLGEEAVMLEPGYNSFTFASETTTSGILELRAEIVGADDTFARNNRMVATTMVEPPPRVLIVVGSDVDSEALKSAIWPDIESTTILAQDLPSRLSTLQSYDGMVLMDVSSYNLSLDQMTTVREFVRSEGRGLVVIGGNNAYSLGAYKDTPLEDMLPVQVEPPPRSGRSDVALLLMIDRSASMSIPIDVSKFDMAKEAAILSSEMLQSEDKIGILAFDTGQNWTVPFQSIGAGLTLKQIQDSIVLLGVGGGTNIYDALNEGLSTLMGQEASVRHAVILTDGRSYNNDRNAYRSLIQTAVDNDITLSAIAIGLDADTELLDQLAEWGNGRYYFADAPDDIPRLTLQESEIAHADPVVEGMLYPELGTPHALLRDFSVADLPMLNGYVATTRRDGAQVVLQSPAMIPEESDPILATWQYGLGRVVAWTPSAHAPWAEAWVQWSEYGAFWSQVIRYTLPEPDSGPLQVHVEPQPGSVRLAVDAFGEGGDPLLADAYARITVPNGTQRELVLHQVAPGRYTQDLLLSTEGAYMIEVALDRDGEQLYARTGYAHTHSREYTPYLPYSPTFQNASHYPQGADVLRRIADLTGGQVLGEETLAEWQGAETTEGQEAEASPSLWAFWQESLWSLLVGAALVLWLLEVAIRRRAG